MPLVYLSSLREICVNKLCAVKHCSVPLLLQLNLGGVKSIAWQETAERISLVGTLSGSDRFCPKPPAPGHLQHFKLAKLPFCSLLRNCVRELASSFHLETATIDAIIGSTEADIKQVTPFGIFLAKLLRSGLERGRSSKKRYIPRSIR